MTEKWKKAFDRFHEENPHVYQLFDSLAKELISAGHVRFGADAIMMQIVWLHKIQTTGSRFKVNYNFVPYYARKWLDNNPAYPGFFQLRAISTQAEAREAA